MPRKKKEEVKIEAPKEPENKSVKKEAPKPVEKPKPVEAPKHKVIPHW
jgi:hypothetical protein